MISQKSSSTPEMDGQVLRRGKSAGEYVDGDSTEGVKFFKRFSSIKVEHEKEKRKTVMDYRSSSYHSSDVIFFQSKEQILEALTATLDVEQVEEVYVEVLCLLFPTREARARPDSTPLVAFLQRAFHMDNPTHTRLMGKATDKEAGDVQLHLEVVEARNLPAKDLNGLSDPFCTLFVTSKELSQRTKTVHKTLNPVWKESFKFPVKHPQTDFLRIDVWDYDPEERMRDKIKRLGEIKNSKAVGSFVREFAHGRKSTQEFMGRYEIPIKDLSLETLEKWVPLENNESVGELYLSMTLGINKERVIGVDQYRLVLQALIIHEVQKGATMVPFYWEHKFEPWSEYLLRQLRTGWGLKSKDVLLARWLSYTKVHIVFPLSGRVFPAIIHDVFDGVRQGHYNNQQASLAWEAAENLVEFSCSFVEKMHDFFTCNVTLGQLHYILKALQVLRNLSPDQLPGSLTNSVAKLLDVTILKEIKSSIFKGAVKFFKIASKNCGVDGIKITELPVDKRIEKLLKVGQLLHYDLTRGLQAIDKDFKNILGVEYHAITYTAYDQKYGEIVKPLVSEFCECLRSVCEGEGGKVAVEGGGNTVDGACARKMADPAEWTSAAEHFFQLYLSLKQFAELCPSPDDAWVIPGSFHNWFYPGVTHVLDIFRIKWMTWMRRAILKDFGAKEIEKDLLDYKGVKISNSSVDAIQIFTGIQSFWVSLAWPDKEQSVTIVTKILQELCGYSVCYAELVSQNYVLMEEKDVQSISHYQVSVSMCRFINDMDYVGVQTRDIASLLNVDEICGEGSSVMEKQLEIQKSGLGCVIEGVLKLMGSKIQPVVEKLLTDLFQLDGKATDSEIEKLIKRCIEYYGKNLNILQENLLLEYMTEATNVIWDETLRAFKKVISVGLKEERGWHHFTRLKSLLDILKGYLEADLLLRIPSKAPSLSNHPKLQDLYKSLDKYSSSTADLEICYFKRRLEQQQEGKPKGKYGMVTLKLFYDELVDILQVQVFNASKLQSSDSNGLSDPYAELTLVPSEKFPGNERMCTKVHKETLCPLFEQNFSIGMKEGAFDNGGFLRVRIYDYDYIGKDEFLGEAFVPLDTIDRHSDSPKVDDCPKHFLTLTKPVEKELEFLNALLSHRTYDKEAIRFIKNENLHSETFGKK